MNQAERAARLLEFIPGRLEPKISVIGYPNSGLPPDARLLS
jgi:hypothetical protein